jgi:LysR family glycine cleavage system transcriptional activator
MAIRNTPVNWLRAFEVAARHLSLSAAASELNVTPAAVSQQVRLLEHRLGEKLFVRHARGLRMTPAGEALVPACRESFERLDTALTELFGNRGGKQLVIRVSFGFGTRWLLDKIAALHASTPIFRFVWSPLFGPLTRLTPVLTWISVSRRVAPPGWNRIS